MYLLHNTDESYMNKILSDGKLYLDNKLLLDNICYLHTGWHGEQII